MAAPNGSYSADVRLQLVVGERVVEVEQVSPDSCLVEQPFDHPPCGAELILQVDGRRRCWTVFLADGISASSGIVNLG